MNECNTCRRPEFSNYRSSDLSYVRRTVGNKTCEIICPTHLKKYGMYFEIISKEEYEAQRVIEE